MKTKPKGLDNPSTVTVIKVMSAINTWIYRRTGGRVGRTWRVGSAWRKGVPICLLTTTGRISGQPRTVPLCYLADGDRIVLVASQGGLPKNPQWYANLMNTPDTTVRVAREGVRRVRAREAVGEEREQLWPRLVDLYADFADYAAWTDRTIPVIVLEPR